MTLARCLVDGYTLWGIRRWKRRVSLAVVACGMGVSGSASSHPDSPPVRAPWAFFAGFTSHALTDPGVHLGAEYSLARTGGFESLAVAAVQVYNQPNTETGIALHARWAHRYTAGFGLIFDSQLGLGAQYTRYDTTAFEFQGSRATAVESTDARVAFSPQVVFGPGYDFEPALSLPISLYARPSVVVLYPDLNQAFQAFVIAELGLSWTP